MKSKLVPDNSSIVSGSGHRSSNGHNGNADGHVHSKKILVVDDDPSILEAIAFMLDCEGYDAVTDNGETIETTISNTSPGLILLDIMLGSANGRDVAKKLKSTDETKAIPIIFLSASANMNLAAAREIGVEDYIAKPFEMDDLLAKIAKYTTA